MEDKELFERLGKIEVREGKERQIKSYVLRNNVLDDKDKEIVTKYFPSNGLFFENEPMDYKKVFGNENPVVIEIGFGMGDSTAKIAMVRPEVNFIGLEVYLKGYVKLLNLLGSYGIKNVKIMRFNAVDVLNVMIPDNSVDGFHVFFPDPWPKKKHHKRRIMNQDFLNLLARKLKKGGYFYMVTDWEEYAEEVLALVDNEPLLMNPHNGFAPPVKWRPTTKFEKKGMEKDYNINEIWFEKR